MISADHEKGEEMVKSLYPFCSSSVESLLAKGKIKIYITL